MRCGRRRCFSSVTNRANRTVLLKDTMQNTSLSRTRHSVALSTDTHNATDTDNTPSPSTCPPVHGKAGGTCFNERAENKTQRNFKNDDARFDKFLFTAISVRMDAGRSLSPRVPCRRASADVRRRRFKEDSVEGEIRTSSSSSSGTSDLTLFSK